LRTGSFLNAKSLKAAFLRLLLAISALSQEAIVSFLRGLSGPLMVTRSNSCSGFALAGSTRLLWGDFKNRAAQARTAVVGRAKEITLRIGHKPVSGIIPARHIIKLMEYRLTPVGLSRGRRAQPENYPIAVSTPWGRAVALAAFVSDQAAYRWINAPSIHSRFEISNSMEQRKEPDPKNPREKQPGASRETKATEEIDNLTEGEEPAAEKSKEAVADHKDARKNHKDALKKIEKDFLRPEQLP
jgi:hypothetical protein